MNIRDLLKRHEGVRNKPYVDTAGKVTIGVGHNLTDIGLTNEQIEDLLTDDIERAETECHKYDWFAGLSECRKAAVIDFQFNVGPGTFASFRTFIACMSRGDWDGAGAALEHSLWYKQVKARGPEIVNMIVSERWPV